MTKIDFFHEITSQKSIRAQNDRFWTFRPRAWLRENRDFQKKGLKCTNLSGMWGPITEGGRVGHGFGTPG